MELLFPPSLGELRATARAELLESWFGRWLGEKVTVSVAETYAELETRLVAAEVDLAWAPPLLCAKIETGVRAILKAVRAGRSTYRAALVSRDEQKLSPTAAALTGRKAVWVDPLSAGGYLLPTAYLRAQGVDPDVTFAQQSFLGSYRAALRAVLLGEADVAPIYTADDTEESVRASMSECIGPERARLAPFAFTAEAPNDGLVVTEKMSRPAAETFVRRLAPFGVDAHSPNLLLAVLAADRLERAAPNEYAAFAATVKRR